MISVDLYRDVLPDWTRLRMLEEAEDEAATELLVAIALLGDASDDRKTYEILKAAWLDMLCGDDPTTQAALAAHIDTSYDRVQSLFDHPHAFGILLASACSRLRSPITQFHVMCLFTVTVFYTGPDERQVELCYRIGKKFGMIEARVEELFARMWNAYQVTRTQADVANEYARGTHWRRNAADFRASNPFQKAPR